jgi:hypothetical protein
MKKINFIVFLLFSLIYFSCYGQETEIMRSSRQIVLEPQSLSTFRYSNFLITTKNDSLFLYSDIFGLKKCFKIYGYSAKNSYYYIQMGQVELILDYESKIGQSPLVGAFWIDKTNNYSLYLYSKNGKEL